MTYQAVARTLGLNKPTDTSFDLIELTREGIPRSAIDALANSLKISIPDLTHYLHISERTLQRYSPDKHLSIELSDRLLQIAKVYSKSLDVFEDSEVAANWLKQPNIALGHIAPITYLDTSSGVEIVLDELTRIEYGVFS
jgi:putative toxin-antitoxin system antitoxin component (TIGR02293 family)